MATSAPMSAAAASAVLRDFLLAAERAKQPLDAAVQRFADVATRESRILQVFLEATPHADAVFHIWPDESGKGTRWEDRESIARFLEIVNNLLLVQLVDRQAQEAAEAMALKIVREKSANLEKLLSWSDKPIIEFRVLELMATIVSVGPTPARELVRIFNFQGASFAKIAGRRLKKPIATATEPEVTVNTPAPSFQIRAAYVRLVAALAACADKSVHRFALKEGGLTSSLLKSLDGDDAEMMAVVLGHLNTLVLQNENLDTRGRAAIFNNAAVQQLVAVVKSEDDDAASQAWTMVHKLFFSDSGLFRIPARQSLRLFLLKSSVNAALASADAVAVIDAAAATDNAVTENINATVKVIRNVIGSISTNDYVRSERVRELVAKLLLEYPGLVAEFLQILAPQLEPKTGYRWFSVASMVQNVLSTSLDAVIPDILAPASTTIDSAGGYTAQLLASRLILPLNCRKELSRGLQHTNNLVIYSALGIMECSLRRFQFFQANLPTGVARSDLENEFRFLLPSPEALVSLLMKLSAIVETAALAYLRALAVFRLYLECLPQAMSEVKADFTKLLAWQYLDATDDGNMSRAMRGVIAGEVLRILMVVDESRLHYVVASGSATNDASRSKLSQLLRLFASSTAASGQATRVLARGVLVRVLTALKAFGTDGGEEIGVWLDNLVTGGDGAIVFVETILQDLVADPFAFLAPSSSESDSSSPATLALIAALHGRWPLPRSMSKLEAVRQNPAVLAFGSRVLVSLMCRSVDLKSVARLIASGQLDEDSDTELRSTKKRRRSESIDLTTLTSFQCLQLLAQQIVSPKTIRPMESAAAPSEWKSTKTQSAFVDALFSLDASSFVVQFPKIVQNLLRLGLSAVWLHQYIGARPDVDLVALLDSVAAQAKTDKQFGPVLRDLVNVLPLHLFSQRIVFALAVHSNAEQHKNVIKLVKQLEARLEAQAPGQPRDAVAFAAEQLLVAIHVLRNGPANSLVGSLADGLLRLLLVVFSGDSETASAATKRLRLKLKTATISSHQEPKLLALDMVALSLGTSDESATLVGQRLRQRGSAVATILLGQRLPVVLRLHILQKLLALQKSLTSSARHAPVVASILQTLDSDSSIRDFAEAKRLTGQVWRSIISLSGQSVDAKTLRVLSAGLHVLSQLGGISEASFRKTVPSTWVPVLSQTLSKHTELGVDVVVKFMRRLCNAIAPRELVAARGSTRSAVEELVSEVVKKATAEKSTRVFAVAVALMATYGTDAAAAVGAATHDSKLITQVLESVMRGASVAKPHEAALGLIVLRHAATHDESPTSVFNSLVQVVASLKAGSPLTPSLVLALLLTLRSRVTSECGWSSEIVSFLTRSAVAHISSNEEESNAGANVVLQSVLAMVQDLLLHAPSPSTVVTLATKSSAEMKKLLDADIESEAAYIRFVRASRVVVSLVSAQSQSSEPSVKGYSVSEHFDKLTTSAHFAASLSNPSINVELIRLVASLLRLGPETLYSRTVFQHLLGSYNASLSLPDRMIRALIDGFESKMGILASQYGYRFGASSIVLSQKQDGSIRSDLVEDSAWLLSGGLEASRVRATIEWFPLNRAVSVKDDARLLLEERADSDEDERCADVDEQALAVVYDPSYLLPMLSRFVSSSALSDVAIVQQGVLSVALRAVSSNADDTREYAYGILAHVHEALSADAATDFKPGRQIHLMLDTLRNAIQEPLEGVSSLITVFMNDAVSILSRPGHAMYPHLNHFLLARPALDLSDVPMFYSLFNSHSPLTYKQERSWLLHGLRRGVREDADVSLLIRRHVPSILLSFFASDLADDHTQLLVAKILTAMLKTETGATYLLTKCAFLEWLTARFHESSTSSLAVLQALSTLLENSLETELWEHIDASQRHALSTAAVGCYEVFSSAVTRRLAHKIPATKELMARIAQLLLQRAYAACSLATFTTLFDESILVSEEGDNTIAMVCAGELATSRLLTHPEFQKPRFAEWSSLLARVARVLSHELRVLISADASSGAQSATSVGQEIRAKDVLTSLRSVLMEAPSLRLLVLEQLGSELATAALLL